MTSRFRILAATAAVLAPLLLSARAEAYEQILDQLSREMAQDIAAAGKSTLAVVDFNDLQGNVTALGRFLAEEFSAALADAGQGFRVIDRIHLATLLREHKLAATGLTDPSTARKLGKIAEVEALITGSLTPIGDSIRIAVKILDTESAAVIGAARGNIPNTGAISALMAASIDGPSEGSKPSASPAPAMPSQQTIESNDFAFALRGCKVSGGKVTCNFIITNQGEKRELTFRSETRAFDEGGNELKAAAYQLGNKTADPLRGYWLENDVISGIPTKAEISFSMIGEDAQLLTVIEIRCKEGFNTFFDVEFRNVPLAR